MRIDAIDLYSVNNELITPWVTAYGSDSTNTSVFVKLTSGNYSAWGETSPLNNPTFSSEYSDGVYEVIRRYLAPKMLHRNLESAEEVNELFAFIKGNYFAKSALEIAWWVLQAKTKDIPLFQLIGISYTESIVGGTVGVE